jgi:L-seryl-tRNA(Ser) seleniumtransferase
MKSADVLRRTTIAIVAALAAACASTPSQTKAPKGHDLSGEWVLTTESQMGAQDAQMTVRQTGNALAGTISSRAGSVDYTGSVNGAAIAFDFTINVQGTDLKLDYSGTVQGDTMQGKAVFGQFGEGTFMAKRK